MCVEGTGGCSGELACYNESKVTAQVILTITQIYIMKSKDEEDQATLKELCYGYPSVL